MNIIDALLSEHGLLYVLFGQIEESLAGAETLQQVLVARDILETTLLSHAKVEDTLLFPALEPHFPGMGPLHVMRCDHEEIHGILGKASASKDKDEACRMIRFVLQVARNHFAKEEQVLFRMARQVLSEKDLATLGQDWSNVRGFSNDIFTS